MTDDRQQDIAEELEEEIDSQTVVLRIIAALLIVGAMHMLGSVLIPFFLAIVVAIALSPLADRLERLGLPRSLSSLAGLLLLTGVLVLTIGLVVRQAGSILRDSEQHLSRFSDLVARGSSQLGADRTLESLGMLSDADRGGGSRSEAGDELRPTTPADEANKADGPGSGEVSSDDARQYWFETVRNNARALGRWLVTGIGGLLGFLGGIVIFLAFVFYMLLTRTEWMSRLRRAMISMGLKPSTGSLEKIRDQLVTYIGFLALVSASYVVVVSLALWAIGVPQPLLWGILTGLLEVVPYFGPLLATAMPTILALSSGEGWWQPVAVIGLYTALQAFEGYVVSPMVYGRAVDIDPVTVLFGVLFFGLVWGPLGLAAAMPMMIMIRGLLSITPETPALDALADVESVEEASTTGRR